MTKLSVRIAQTKQDLDACFYVRHEVFIAELRTASKDRYPGQRECDSFDTLDTTTHLLVSAGPDPVGTVRILEPNPLLAQAHGWAYGFSLEQSFRLDAVHAELGERVVELPRSSVLKAFRSGYAVTSVLWAAAANLIRLKGYRFVVAGTNPQTDDIEEATRIFQEMRRSQLVFSPETAPRGADAWVADSLDVDASSLKLPPILATFVGLGGLALGPPIFDPHVRSCNLPMIWSLSSSKLSRLFSQEIPFSFS